MRIFISLCLGMLLSSPALLAQGGCSTLLESVADASTDELSNEYRRLASYKNPYCDTTGSDFQQIMEALGKKLTAEGASQQTVLDKMGEPYYKGALEDYEKQKLTIGRDGKPTGKALPPSYKLPAGDYFIVYLWRKKDYLVFAFKGGKATASKWWEKGDYR